MDTGAGSHLVSKAFDKQAAEIDPTPDTGMVTVTGQPLATGRKKRSVIQIGSGKFSIDYAESDKVNFSVLREGCRKGTWIVVGPEQQCMILGRNADKIKKALVETAKNLIKKRGVYWLSVEATHPAGRSAGLAGSTAQPVAAIRPARNAVPASAFEGEDGSDGFVDRGSC